MPVISTHPDYAKAIKRVKKTRDAVEGGDAVLVPDYIPKFIPNDDDRYKQYLSRAYYTNFVGRTNNAMVGAVFRKDFKRQELPDRVAYLMDNANGEGMGLEQLAKRAVDEINQAGEYIFVADYPEGLDNPSLEDVNRLGLMAHIKTYRIECMINFNTRIVNGVEVLSLVVMKENKQVPVDMYEYKNEARYRVFALDDDGKYYQALYDESGNLDGEIKYPRQNGSSMTHIPAYIAGTVDTRFGYDKPALLDMAEVNLAHLRNTTDREEELHLVCQKMIHVDVGETPTEEWDKQNPNGVVLGSARGIVTRGGGAKLIEPQATSEYQHAIELKENQLIAIGAKLIKGKGINETAETARINASSEVSVLNTIAGNVSTALEKACEDCDKFMGGTGEGIEIELNDSFYDETLTQQDIQSLVELKAEGILTNELILSKLRSANYFESDKADEEILEEAEADPAPVGGDI